MSHRSENTKLLLAAMAFVVALSLAASAEVKPKLITQAINNQDLVTLYGNTRPEVNAANDRGPVSADLQFDHMLLILKRPPQLEKEFSQLVEDMHNPKSPQFHKWLSANEIGERFGLAQSDTNTIKAWLEDNGFKVNVTYANGVVLDFSGNAGQIENAFHTQIRNYMVNGVNHVANSSNPKIPAALAGAIIGPASLNDFKGKAMNQKLHGAHIDPKTGKMADASAYTIGSGNLPLVPNDLQTIYNIGPLFSAGISGQGMKIVVVEDTNLFNCNASNGPGPCSNTSDWATFRKYFGLIRYSSGNLSQSNPAPQTGTNNCTNPGDNANDVEAAIDVEWATAAAPSASIINAACRDPRGSFGGLIAIQNILSHPNADNVDVISMSYGESESQTGATLNAAFDTTFQQAVAQGIGIFVSSGDEDAASRDNGAAQATHGIQISGWMSSQYDVSVGGLDFADTYLGQNSTYWNSTNNVFYGSAKSYMPEQPWNDSCAGTLLAHFETGSFLTYGSTGFCNTTAGANFYLAVGGSGGPSACATGAAPSNGTIGGTCAGRPKPSYQSAYLNTMAGMVNDNVRDTPDVSLMAANGLWGHYYIICYSNPANNGNGGVPCTGQPINWPGFGGTSVSSPIMAAIQALVIQHKGSLQGNPNPRYYALANAEYGPGGKPSCNSSLGNGVSSSCVFYDVTLGDIDANCKALSGTLHNCYLPSGTVGVLSTSNNAYQPAYPTTTGWDFASGIGSVNAYNLVMGY